MERILASASMGRTKIAALPFQALVAERAAETGAGARAATATGPGTATGERVTLELKSRFHMLENGFEFCPDCFNAPGTERLDLILAKDDNAY